MRRYSISVPAAVPSGLRFDASSLPTLSLAVQAVAEDAHASWLAYARGEPLPGGGAVRDPGGTYARSIKLRQTGDFAAEVSAEGRRAEEIEDGTPSRDLKRMLWTSKKTRVNEKGQRYLIIPFRWNAGGGGGANALPPAVAHWWKRQAASRVVGWTTRISGSGHEVPQRLYNWGSSLQKPDLKALGVRGAKAKNMAGMVVFRSPGGRGGGTKSSFLTFRTMSESQTGKWITKPKPGLHVARTVARQAEQAAYEAFRRAVEEDISRALGRL